MGYLLLRITQRRVERDADVDKIFYKSMRHTYGNAFNIFIVIILQS